MSILLIWLLIATSGMYLHSRLFPNEPNDLFDKIVLVSIYFFASPVLHILLMMLSGSKPKWNFISIMALIIYITLNILLCAQLLNIS